MSDIMLTLRGVGFPGTGPFSLLPPLPAVPQLGIRGARLWMPVEIYTLATSSEKLYLEIRSQHA